MPGAGLYVNVKLRQPGLGPPDTPVARPLGSIPSVPSMSRPASTLLPVVTHEPSGIHPRLSKLGSSLIRVNRDRATEVACLWLTGVASDGESGAGLSLG